MARRLARRRAEHRPGPSEAAGARRRAGRAPGAAGRAGGGRRPGMAGAGRPAGGFFATGETAADRRGLPARARRLDQGRRRRAGAGRAGPVLVPVLPGRRRPERPVARRNWADLWDGSAATASRPAGPGAGRLAARAWPRSGPRPTPRTSRTRSTPGRRRRARPGREAVPGRGRRRGRRLLGRRYRYASGEAGDGSATPGCGARRAGRRPLPDAPGQWAQAAAMLERRVRPGPVAGERRGGAARHPADRRPRAPARRACWPESCG